LIYLQLVPTIIEMVVMSVIFSTAYDSSKAAGVLSGMFMLYMVVTMALTQVRCINTL
jgi:ABC-type transport system involved in Fe-S cluster assembly fused permease/ATPase subunit